MGLEQAAQGREALLSPAPPHGQPAAPARPQDDSARAADFIFPRTATVPLGSGQTHAQRGKHVRAINTHVRSSTRGGRVEACALGPGLTPASLALGGPLTQSSRLCAQSRSSQLLPTGGGEGALGAVEPRLGLDWGQEGRCKWPRAAGHCPQKASLLPGPVANLGVQGPDPPHLWEKQGCHSPSW